MKKFTAIITVVLFTGLTTVLSAEGPAVDEIVDKAYRAAYYAGKDGKADVKMTITDRQGRERIREFAMLRLDIKEGAEQKFYVYFKKPEDIAGMVYMAWKNVKKDDDRWLYLPALDLVRRIAASDKRSSFAGSDFLYEDVSGRGITEDTHTLIETTDKYYKLKNVPKDEDSVEFAYFLLWIDKKTFLPSKAEYYDSDEELYRIVEALEVKEIGGYPTVTKSKVQNLESGSSTVTEFTNISYDVGLTKDIFTERYLRKQPRKWIK